jgi:DNA polymerase I-like protein with 3'-5' exonuclease and polymerase domains
MDDARINMDRSKNGERAEPPLQNIPIRTELGAQLRAAFFARRPIPRILYSSSFSDLEARIFELYCQKSTRRSS